MDEASVAAPGVWWWQGEPTANAKRILTHDEVQLELMRHAAIQTTMSLYGQAMLSSKTEAKRKVVEMVLKPVWANA